LNLTSESLQALLTWLDPDTEIAGQKYETIRAGLIRVFASQGFSDAEDLTDITVDRVITRLPDIRETYIGEPAKYFHGVARKIILEVRGRKEIFTDKFPERPLRNINTSDHYDCLLRCLKKLPPEKREMILDYHLYDYEESVKIEHHKSMAKEQGIPESTLRVRAHRMRAALEKCILQCVKKLG
jgi:RNA polymerase sigma factor (sigma-70 family)